MSVQTLIPRDNRYWRLSVWGFRTAVLAIVVVAGSLVSVLTIDAGEWVLFGALCAFYVSDLVIFSGLGLVLTMCDLSKPRPSFKTLRRALGHDALCIRSQTVGSFGATILNRKVC